MPGVCQAVRRPAARATSLACDHRSVERGRTIQVTPSRDGLRLDLLIARDCGISRGYARRLLARGAATIGGHVAAKGTFVRTGEEITLAPFRHPERGPLGDEAGTLSILAESHGLLALDKPAGLPTAPLDFDESHTALGCALAIRPAIAGIGDGGLQSGLVHRLDTWTSGVLVFATREDAWQRARAAFATRQVRKGYVALVHGRFARSEYCELRLAQRGDHVVAVEHGGRASVTRLEPVCPGDRYSVVEVHPHTGTRHQIRATLAALGHPIVGDRIYGSPVDVGRHLLHAASIGIGDFEARSLAPEAILEGAE